MNIFGDMQGFGPEAWMRALQRFGGAFQARPGAGAFDGAGWPGAMPWPGAADVFASMPSAAGLDGLGGPFGDWFQQFSQLAQAQWQALAQRALSGIDMDADAFSDWHKFAEPLLRGMAPAPDFLAMGVHGLPGRDALREALSTPPVGPVREHVERWQAMALAQLDYQEAAQDFAEHLKEVMELTWTRFNERLDQRREEEQPIESLRGVLDEWIAAGEQAWAERAGTDDFVSAMGRYSNAQTRVRASMAREVNRIAESLGLPTREEVDRDHQRIAQLEREVRRLRREMEAGHEPAPPRPVPAARAAGKTAVKRAQTKKIAAGKTAAAKAAGKTTATKKAAAKRAPAKRAVTKKVAAKKSVAKQAPAKKAPAKKAAARKTTATQPATKKAAASVLPKVAAPRALGTKQADTGAGPKPGPARRTRK